MQGVAQCSEVEGILVLPLQQRVSCQKMVIWCVATGRTAKIYLEEWSRRRSLETPSGLTLMVNACLEPSMTLCKPFSPLNVRNCSQGTCGPLVPAVERGGVSVTKANGEQGPVCLAGITGVSLWLLGFQNPFYPYD